MTNDEIRRNDEIRMSKPAIAPLSAFRHSGFGFLSSFVIRHSTTCDPAPVAGQADTGHLAGSRGQENIFTLFLCLAVASGLKVSPCEPDFCLAPLEAGRHAVAWRRLAPS